MSEIERIKTELNELLESLETEHLDLKTVKDELQQNRSEETAIRNNIIGLSKKILALQGELDDYLEE